MLKLKLEIREERDGVAAYFPEFGALIQHDPKRVPMDVIVKNVATTAWAAMYRDIWNCLHAASIASTLDETRREIGECIRMMDMNRQEMVDAFCAEHLDRVIEILARLHAPGGSLHREDAEPEAQEDPAWAAAKIADKRRRWEPL